MKIKRNKTKSMYTNYWVPINGNMIPHKCARIVRIMPRYWNRQYRIHLDFNNRLAFYNDLRRRIKFRV